MWQWLRDLAKQRADFAFETTLASRTFAPFIAELKSSGYAFELIFFWLPTADLAIERVRGRVRAGGHSIPDDTIRRRHGRGMANFIHLYRPLADVWSVLDNSWPSGPVRIARGRKGAPDEIVDSKAWSRFLASAESDPTSP